jgi:uncharacterized protein YbjT (DUF2867 family)
VRVLVIGGSGPLGQQVLAHLADHQVTVLARSALALDGMTVLRGDARNAGELEAAVRSQDAVISALGSKKVGPDDLQTAFLTGITAAMTANGVARLISVTPWGAGASRASAPLLMRMGAATILRNQLADREAGEAVVAASALSYTHVRAGALGNGAERGGVIGTSDGRGIRTSIARADVAAFMVGQLTDDSWLRREVIIGYRKG